MTHPPTALIVWTATWLILAPAMPQGIRIGTGVVLLLVWLIWGWRDNHRGRDRD